MKYCLEMLFRLINLLYQQKLFATHSKSPGDPCLGRDPWFEKRCIRANEHFSLQQNSKDCCKRSHFNFKLCKSVIMSTRPKFKKPYS